MKETAWRTNRTTSGGAVYNFVGIKVGDLGESYCTITCLSLPICRIGMQWALDLHADRTAQNLVISVILDIATSVLLAWALGP